MRAWEEFLSYLKQELGEPIVERWIAPLKVIRFDACNLYLEAKDSFSANWFDEHIRPIAEKKLVNNNQKRIKIHLALSSQPPPYTPPTHKKTPLPREELVFNVLDPKCRFDNFVTSQKNLLAYKLMSEEVMQSPPTFNPIYLFGRPGTGKTHLMMATALSLKAQGLKVIYVRADTFTEHVVGAIRSGEMRPFRAAYRNIDALLIDDIEIFSRKGATQEELFHTFNTLHVEGKRIIFSATLPPQELQNIEPRLVSRFEWGITVPLQALEKKEIRLVLNARIEAMKFPLSEKVIEYLIDTFGHNTASIMRAVEALILRQHLNRTTHELTLEGAQRSLNDLIQAEKQALLTPARILKSVAEYYGIQIDDILSKSQKRQHVLPRQISMHLCRAHLKLPYIKIADIFYRDHSTVMASIKQIERGIESKSSEIAAPVKSITKSLET